MKTLNYSSHTDSIAITVQMLFGINRE